MATSSSETESSGNGEQATRLLDTCPRAVLEHALSPQSGSTLLVESLLQTKLLTRAGCEMQAPAAIA